MGSDARTDVAARRATFLRDADDYERYRPGYPDVAIAWLVGARPQAVIDVGCGPGNLTRRLAELGHDVLGVDPSAAMLTSARRRELRVIRGSAEALPFASACADVVTAATAFHWFDHERAVPEMRRVLRPGGRVGVLTNIRDENVPWIQALSDIIGSEAAMAVTLGGGEGMETEFSRKLEGAGLFRSTEHRVFAFEQRLTEERLIGLVRSRSYIAILPDGERETLLHRVAELCHKHPDLAGRREFSMPYETHALRAIAV